MKAIKLKIGVLMLVSLMITSGCDSLKTEYKQYYMSFVPVEGIVIEKMGKPNRPGLENSIDRPLDYRLEREDYTLYIKNYDWNYGHTQYILSAVAKNGEDLDIDFAIPINQWPKDDYGNTNAIYCYHFADIRDDVRRKRLGIAKDKKRILVWVNLDRSLKCEGGARDGPLNRIDLSLFSADGRLVAQEFLPVENIANGIIRTK